MNQNSRVLEYMKANGGITSAEAFETLGVTRLSARIKELKDAGHKIEGTFAYGKNRFGEPCTWKKYSLADDGETVL